MGYQTVTILQRKYNISCSEEELPHLKKCTNYVNNIVDKIHNEMKSGSENTVMAMALLTIADEFIDYKEKNKPQDHLEKHEVKQETSIPEGILDRLEVLNNKLAEAVK